MTLTRDEILAMRQEFEREFGSGESDWADTTPEGLRLWDRTHPRPVTWVYLNGNVLTSSTGPVRGGTTIASTAIRFPTHLYLRGAVRVSGPHDGVPVRRSKAPLQTQFEAVLM
jgi:hypothetical protein